MLRGSDIHEILRLHQKDLYHRFHVSRIGLFGSCLRADFGPDSDVDILVEFDGPMGWEFVDLKDHLEELLGREVDLVTQGALKPRLREPILREVAFL